MEMVTERLVLRRWRPDDEADIAAAFELFSREEISRWRGGETCHSLDEAAGWVEQWQIDEQERQGYGRWAIMMLRDRTPIGSLKLTSLTDADGSDTDDIEIGWHLHPDHWGHGYATEAAARLLEHAWELDLDEVNAVIEEDNHRSQAVATRLDMTYQGVTDRWLGRQMGWWLIGAPLPPAA